MPETTVFVPTKPNVTRPVPRVREFGGYGSYAGGVVTRSNPGTGSNDGEPYTEAQVRFDQSTGMLPHDSMYQGNRFVQRRVDYQKLRAMRRDPTIALARDMAVAPILAGSWSTELVDHTGIEGEQAERITSSVEKYVKPLRNALIRTAILGEIDYGWRAYEKIFELIKDDTLGFRVIHKRVKPLRADYTWARYDDYGEFMGLLHQDMNAKGWFVIDNPHSLFINFDDDGCGDYNDPRLMRCEQAFDEWNVVNQAARRFDEKVAGAMWVISFPEGHSVYKGVRMDNYAIAEIIASQMKASGHLLVPNKILMDAASEMEEGGTTGWTIQLLESSGKQGDFVTRMEYLDKLKVRGMGVLERTIMEGLYGTKAEAGTHYNVNLLGMQLQHEDVTEIVNTNLVDQHTELNEGLRGVVRFKAEPLNDDRKDVLATLFTAFLADPNVSQDITTRLNIREVMDLMKIPQLTDEQIAEKEIGTLGGMFNMITQQANTETQPSLIAA